MGLRQRMYELTTVEELEEFLVRFPTGAVFKAGSCHKTSQGFGQVEQALDPREELHLAFVRVIESRPVSNAIAERTGITHQSPQFILFVDGQAVYDVDNWDISAEVIVNELDKHLGQARTAAPASAGKNIRSDVSGYITLLEDFVQGNISSQEFEHKWLTTFQMDATPRSTEEFDTLNSLFGDVDQALQGGFQRLDSFEKQQTELLKDKAHQVLSSLKE